MIKLSKSLVTAVGAGIAVAGMASVLWSATAVAAPVSVVWTTTNIDTSADSRAGDFSQYQSISSNPDVLTTSRDLNQASGAAPTVDTTLSSVVVNGGSTREQSAGGQVTVTGSTGGTMSVANGGGSTANNAIDTTVIHGAQFNGSSTFVGDFVSNGTSLTLDYSGLYSIFAFGANGATFSKQRAFAQLSASLLVQDITTATTLLPTTSLVSNTQVQNLCSSPCLPFRLDDIAFGNTVAIDLSATSGDVIAITLLTSIVTKSYAGHSSGDPQQTRGVASASFHTFDFAFTTEEALNVVPLPAGLPLFGTGLSLMGLFGWLRRRKAAAAA